MILTFQLQHLDRGRLYALGRVMVEGCGHSERVFVIPETPYTVLAEWLLKELDLDGRLPFLPIYQEIGRKRQPQAIRAPAADLTYRFGQEDGTMWTDSINHRVFFCDAYIDRLRRRFADRKLLPDQNDAQYAVGGVIGWTHFSDHEIQPLPWTDSDDHATFAIGDCRPSPVKS